MGEFAARIAGFVNQAEEDVATVVKESAQRTMSIAQTPIREGGHMPVVSAFLRNTGGAELNGMPSGPARPDDGAPGEYSLGAISLVIAGYKLGDSIGMGWSAIYARKVEEIHGFREDAAMKWTQTVEAVVREVRMRVI